MQRHAILVGASVEFDTEDGPQAGVVEQFKSDVGNGQRIAVVRVAGTMGGAPWHMPVEQLQRVKAAA